MQLHRLEIKTTHSKSLGFDVTKKFKLLFILKNGLGGWLHDSLSVLRKTQEKRKCWGILNVVLPSVLLQRALK